MAPETPDGLLRCAAELTAAAGEQEWTASLAALAERAEAAGTDAFADPGIRGDVQSLFEDGFDDLVLQDAEEEAGRQHELAAVRDRLRAAYG